MRLLACCLLMTAAAYAQDRPAVDWRKLEPEILSTFTTLLKIDTSNPPGKETLAANAIQAILERGGIQSRLFASTPNAPTWLRASRAPEEKAPADHGPHRRSRRAAREVDRRTPSAP